MRAPGTGWGVIENFIAALADKHHIHVKEYGHGLAERLTGAHETCSISEFKSGHSDRGASIRIPNTVTDAKCGYIEDRRPGANCDPYRVAVCLLSSYMDSLEK